jgi:hypothetical protein
MKKIVSSMPIVAFLAMASTAGLAQTPEKGTETQKFYKLEFTIKEVEAGKVLNSRSYSVIAVHDARAKGVSIRAGTKIPVNVGPANSGVGGNFSFFDIGVNIDCQVMAEVDGRLSLSVNGDISSMPTTAETTGQAAGGASGPPTIRQNRWVSVVTIPLRKPTLVFASDDMVSKRQMQMEVTATPAGTQP